MSASSLFDSESKKSSNWKFVLIGLVVLIAVCASVYGLYVSSKPREITREEIVAGEIRDSVVMMLAQPTFSGDEFEAQILGKGRMQRFDWKKREAYFSYPLADQAEFDEFLNKFFVNRLKVEIGLNADGEIRLGSYTMSVSPQNYYFFKTPLDNIKIEPQQTLKFGFKDVNYEISLEETRQFTNNSAVFGGKLIAEESQRTDAPKIIFANHGIMVAKPDEPSLKRLTDELLKDETIRNDREKRIQRLVDFVSNEIEYSYTEAVGARETLKRANETLMTRSGDCSNKTILLASLLEQIGEEYILLYCPQHITVAVPQGNFPNENKLDFEWNQKPWMIAETTVPGFQIGVTKVQDAARLQTVKYVQVPRQTDIIFDAGNYNLLKFW